MKGTPLVAIGIGIAILLLLFIAGASYFLSHPLAVYAWSTRRALTRAGLHKVTVVSPAGKQVVWTGGSGPVMVLLHGAGDQAGTWSRVAPALAGSYTLIIPDLAGHGGSAPARGTIEAKTIYEGIVASIDALAPKQKVILAGNSLGGWMAMLIAHRRPERVASIVCIDGGAIKGSNTHANLLPKNRAEARESVAQTRDAKSAPIPDFVLDDIVRQAKRGPLARFAASASSMDAWILDEKALGEIRVPVRLIWGASDKLVPLDYAKRMEAGLKDVRLEIIPDCGHVPQVECPGPFVAALAKAVAK